MKGKGQKGRKLGNNTKFCEAYAKRDQANTNKKKKLGTRIKNHPFDVDAQRRYAVLFGDKSLDGVNASRTEQQLKRGIKKREAQKKSLARQKTRAASKRQAKEKSKEKSKEKPAVTA